MADELYWSVDIETDGPIPGPHSMLSFGAVAVDRNGTEVKSCEYNLKLLPGAAPHPDTQKFWDRNNSAYEVTRDNTFAPALAMGIFVRIVEVQQWQDGRKPIFVAYPAGFDWTFMYWYMMNFAGRSPFGFQALDMKSYAMAKLGLGFRQTVKRRFPEHWKTDLPHTHVAIDDAREQAQIFVAMLNE